MAESRSINNLCASFNSVRNKYSETSKRMMAARNTMVYFVFILSKRGLRPVALTQTQLPVGVYQHHMK